jgi:photosystem II stability/assembly factor-like uncharacterized protein
MMMKPGALPLLSGRLVTAVCLLSSVVFWSSPVSAQVEDIPDTPRLRWEYFFEQRAYPFGEIPGGALQRARQQLEMMPGGFYAAPPAIQGTTWVPLGPETVPIAKTSTGRLTAIAIHPDDSNIIYVGGAQGGVWKTTDGGAFWTPLTDGECSLAMGSIAIDPVNPEILYAGTGEQHFSGDSYYGCGVLRSEDGGNSWTQLGAVQFVRSGAANAKISRVDIDPTTAGDVATTTVLAASNFGLYRSLDGGATWKQVLSGVATDLVRHPNNSQILYAAIRYEGVFKSTDGGVNWEQLTVGWPTENVSRINLALAPSAPETVFASIQHRTESDLLGIWKTANGGGSWTKLAATGASCGKQCWYNMTIAVSPSDSSMVFFGGVSFYRSTDGGVTFQDIRDGIHVDQHHLAFDPQDPSIVYVGNDGGIYKSTSSGTEWTTLNTNLALTQFYAGVSLHPWDPVVSLGGTQDNGTLESYGSLEYNHLIGGDGGFTAIDFLNPIVRYGETQWKAESSFSGPRRSDGGVFARKVNGIDVNERALFIPPLVMDPVNPSRLYFGTVRLYRTEDRAEHWTPISDPFEGRISAIAPAASDPDVVYLGTSNGEVYRTEDGGQSWSQINLGVPNRFIRDLVVDPLDAQRAFLTVSGFGTVHVLRTTDGGGVWQSVSGNLPDVPVNAIVQDPVEPSTLFIGTDVGVFGTYDAGVTWSALTDGLPNVAVFDLAYNPSTGVLLAATHGRGMFTLSLDRALTMAVVPKSRLEEVLIGIEDPVQDSVTVVLTGTDATTTGWTATNNAPWISVTSASGTGSTRIRWTRDLSGLQKGTYVDTIRVSAEGAIDSPFEVVDTLVILAPRTMNVDPTSRSHTAAVGSTTPIQETAAIELSGPDAAIALWEATHSGAAWLTIANPISQGSGTLRWSKDPTGLEEGVYVDTIRVTSVGAEGTPTLIVDTLIMDAPLVGLDPTTRGASAMSGEVQPYPDSARVLLSGAGAETAQWAASAGSSWLTLITGSGSGPGWLRWTRDPTGLPLGTFADTIKVESTNGGQAQLIDTFTLTEPFLPANCVVQHLLSAPCLGDLQIRFLDIMGNGDGVYNLGDFLAHLAREGGGS